MGVNLDIYLRRKDGSEFPADIALSPLQTGSGIVVVAALRDATERKLAQERLHRLAVLEDRERIAKELHDGVIQALFAVGMNLQATEAKANDPDAVRTRLSGAVDSIDMAIRDLRNYIFGLRPGILADRQLDQALHQLVDDFEEKSGVVTAIEIDPRVAAQFGNAAAQIVQVVREALSNVARHAQAATCRVTLVRRDGHAVLEIDDDGRGFDPGHGSPRGQGLRNMRERVEAMGGTFSIESSPANGTTVRVELPL
jgi:signal transduction histidine kinase